MRKLHILISWGKNELKQNLVNSAPSITIFTVISFAILVTFWVTGYPSFQDYGEWVYQGRVLSDLWAGIDTGVADFVDYPVPYALHLLLLAFATRLFGSIAGPMVLLILFAGFAMFCISRFVSKNELNRVSATIFTAAMVFGSGFWNGYLGAQLGVVFIILYLSFPREITSCWYFVFPFSILMFFTHALGFAAWGIIALVRSFESKRFVTFMLAVTPSAVLTLIYVFRSYQPRGQGDLNVDGFVQLLAYKGYAVAKLGSYQNLILRGTGDFETNQFLFYAGVAINFLFALVLCAGMLWLLLKFRSLWKYFRTEYVAGAILIFVAIMLPSFFVGIVNPGERVMIPGLVVLSVILFSKRFAPRWFAPASTLVLVVGGLLTIISLILLPTKDGSGAQVSQPPSGSDNRVSTFFGHRLDQYQEKQVEANDDRADLPLDWSTSIIETP